MNFNMTNTGIGPGTIMLLVALTWLLLIVAIAGIVRSRLDPVEKLMWVVIVIFIPVLGPIMWWTRPRSA